MVKLNLIPNINVGHRIVSIFPLLPLPLIVMIINHQLLIIILYLRYSILY